MTASVLPAPEQQDGLVVSGFRLQERCLVPVGSPTREEWAACLDYLLHVEQHVHFWIGDLLAYGEQRWGPTYAQMVEETGYDTGTLHNLKWVASRVDAEQRRETLSYAHHQEVVRLSPDQQDVVLTLAEDQGWTRDMVRQEAYRVTRSEQALQTAALNPSLVHGDCRDVLAQLPDASIDLLLTDPPYGRNYTSPMRTVPFPQMANDDIEGALTVLDGALALATQKLQPDSHVYVFSCWKTYRPMAAVVRRYFTLIDGCPPEMLFFERCIDWLAPNGLLGIVMPKSFLDTATYRPARELLFRGAQLLAVVNCHKSTFQPDTGVRTCVVFLRKLRQGEAPPPDYQIFLAISRKIGRDSEGKPIFRIDPDGNTTDEIDHDLGEIYADYLRALKGELKSSGYRFTIWRHELDSALNINPQRYLPHLNEALRQIQEMDGQGGWTVTTLSQVEQGIKI